MVDTGSVNTRLPPLNDTAGSAGSICRRYCLDWRLYKYGPSAATFSGPASEYPSPARLLSTRARRTWPRLVRPRPPTGPLVIGDGIGGPNADLVNIFTAPDPGLAAVVVNSSGELNFGTNQDTIGSLTEWRQRLRQPGPGAIQLTQGLTVNQSATMGEKINLIGAARTFTVHGSDADLSGQSTAPAPARRSQAAARST